MSTQTQPTEVTSLLQIRAGDREQMLAELEHHLNTLYRFIARELRYHEALGDLVPGEVTPEEIVDEVAVRALRRAQHQLPRQAALKGWLRMLALRAIEARVRKLRRQHKLEARSLQEPQRTGQALFEYYQPDYAPTLLDGLPVPVRTPEQTLVLRETWQELEQAINELPPEQRMVFVLATIEGLGYAEIAAILHLSRDAVRATYHAAREALRQRFAERFRELPLESR
jgi:RNA polymerase sigma-70 factor (ECF subfamily)